MSNQLVDKALAKVGNDYSAGWTQVTSSYGFNVYYKKLFGIHLLHVDGNSAGAVGTDGHEFTIPNIEATPYFLVQTGYVGTTNYRAELYISNKIKILPTASLPSNSYINVTFVY